jgi:hypothetical protein
MFYFWVILGMEIWAGDIYEGNPVLVDTDFANDDYYTNSFNNFLFAYVTVFELMVVNNWQDILLQEFSFFVSFMNQYYP